MLYPLLSFFGMGLASLYAKCIQFVRWRAEPYVTTAKWQEEQLPPPPPYLPPPPPRNPALDFFSWEFDAALALSNAHLRPPNIRVASLQSLSQCRFILPAELEDSLMDKELAFLSNEVGQSDHYLSLDCNPLFLWRRLFHIRVLHTFYLDQPLRKVRTNRAHNGRSGHKDSSSVLRSSNDTSPPLKSLEQNGELKQLSCIIPCQALSLSDIYSWIWSHQRFNATGCSGASG